MFEKKLESLERGQKEFKIQLALKKDFGINCPEPIEIIKKGKDYYFLMERIDGYTFREVLNNNHISMLKKLYILLFASQNVAKMHEHGIKHSDLKPENIMITKNSIDKGRINFNDVYLIDFDISGAFGKDCSFTPRYKTFEHQFEGDKAIGKETDVQVLGMMLYEIVFGEVPNPRYDIFNEKRWVKDPSFKENTNMDKDLYNELNEIYKLTMKERKIDRIKASSFCKRLQVSLKNYSIKYKR